MKQIKTAFVTFMMLAMLFSAFQIVNAGNENISLSREIAGEGMVLLKNENSALPLSQGESVAIFGEGSIYVSTTSKHGFQIGGGGSSSVTPYYTPADIASALTAENAGGRISVYAPLSNAYRTNITYIPDDAMYTAAAQNADTAIMVISRYSTEGTDRTATAGDYYLSDNEKNILKKLSVLFDKVVVLANIPSAVDTTFAKENSDGIDVDALLVMWYPGAEGANAAADILLGKVNPSGKLAQTFAQNLNDYPTTEGFNNSERTLYTEDVYMGYRYFETFNVPVNYEFGFGLSYTTFEITPTAATVSEGNVNISVTVKNTGSFSGKETVQVYYSAPQKKNGSKLGNPSKELCAFGKTRLLPAGESQTLSFSFPLSDMASFDDTGATGNKSDMVLEKGTYSFYAGNSVKNVFFAGSYTVANDTVTKELHQYCAPTQLSRRLLDDGTYEDMSGYSSANTASAPTVVETATPAVYTPIKTFIDVKNGTATAEELLSQMTIWELSTFAEGHAGGVDYGTGVIAPLQAVTNKYYLPRLETADGPGGLRIGKSTTLWASEALVACTWNTALLNNMGDATGKEAAANKVDIWLAPGVNLIRNPLGGRGFEYYSEDPLLSGKLASALTDGVRANDVFVEIKHFVCNEKELNRNQNDSVISERALRELYLKPFEICVTESDPGFIMSSYNYLNGTETSERYDLLTGILRDEFGFDGVVTTDWGNDSSQLNEVLAGCNVKMPFGYTSTIVSAYNSGTITRSQLIENALPIIEADLDSRKSPSQTVLSGEQSVKIESETYCTINGGVNAATYLREIGHFDSRDNYIPGDVSYLINATENGYYDVSLNMVNHSGIPHYDILKLAVDGVECDGIQLDFPITSNYQKISAGTVYFTQGEHILTLTFTDYMGFFEGVILTPSDAPTAPSGYYRYFNANEVLTSSYSDPTSAIISTVTDPRDSKGKVYYLDAANGNSYAGFAYFNYKNDFVFQKGHKYSISCDICPLTINTDDVTPASKGDVYLFIDKVKSQNKFYFTNLGLAAPNTWTTFNTSFVMDEYENSTASKLTIYVNPQNGHGVNSYIDNIVITDVGKLISFECDEAYNGTLPETIYGLSNATISLPQCAVTVNGKRFMGWSDGSVLYTEGASYVITEETVLKAKFEEIPNYLFNFTADSGTSSGLTASAAVLSTVADPDNAASNVYYIKAWSNGSHATAQLDNSTGLLEFTVGHSYKLTFRMYPVSGTAGALTSNVQTFMFLDKVNGNYIFAGLGKAVPGKWNNMSYTFTANSFTSTAANTLQIQTNPVGSSGVNYYIDDIKLTDLTPVAETYSLSFESFDGYTGTLPSMITSPSGNIVIPQSDIAMNDLTFVGWTDGNKIYHANDNYALSKNVKMLAVWSENNDNSDALRFDGTRSDFDNTGFYSSTSSCVTLVRDPEKDNKYAYKVTALGGNQYISMNYPNTTAGFPLKAGHKYNYEYEYCITGTNKNGGTLGYDGNASLILNVTYSDTPHLVGRGSSTANEWKKVTGSFTVDSNFTPKATDGITLYTDPVSGSGANYYVSYLTITDAKKTISFADSEYQSGTLPTEIYSAAKNVVLIPSCDITREGYTLSGWTDGSNLYRTGESYTVSETKTLHAVWQLCSYTVSFNVGEIGNSVAAQTVNYGSNVQEPQLTEVDNYTFGGWYSDNNFISQYSFTSPVKNNITLYAKWNANLTKDNIVTRANAGYYCDNIDDDNAQKEGIIIFNVAFDSIEAFDDTMTAFGLYFYNSSSLSDIKATLSCNGNIQQLKAENGEFFGSVTDISEKYFESPVIAIPFVVAAGEIYTGEAVSMTVEKSNKWLGKKPVSDN